MSERGPGDPAVLSQQPWDFADYLLAGRGAPIAQVHEQFQDALQTGDSGILLALNSETIYGSLSAYVDRTERRVATPDATEVPPSGGSWSRWTDLVRRAVAELRLNDVRELLAPLFPEADLTWIGSATVADLPPPTRHGPDLHLVVLSENEPQNPTATLRALAASLATTTPVVAKTASVHNRAIEDLVRRQTDTGEVTNDPLSADS